MTFNADTPTVQLDFDLWQVQFQANFQRMSQSFLVNHVPLENASKTGNHTIVQMPEQPKDRKIQTNIGDFAIFTRLVEDQADQVFMRYEGNQPEFQYTNYQLYTIKDRLDKKEKIIQTTSFTTLPGNLMIIFGSVLIKDKKWEIILTPPVMKNIISVNMTLIGTFPNVPAVAYEVTPIKNTVDEVDYFTSIDVMFQKPADGKPFYYLVMGNT